MHEFIQVETTAPSQSEAERIATHLVERSLAACVHVHGPIQSTYRWAGAVEHAEEWVCTAKTTRKLLDEVEEAVVELHSYDCPQLIASPICGGSQSYLDWLAAQLV